MSPTALPGLCPLLPAASSGAGWEQGVSVVSTQGAAGWTDTVVADGCSDHHVVTNVVAVMGHRVF